MGLGSEIRDPEKTYFGSRIQGKKTPDTGSGFATLPPSVCFVHLEYILSQIRCCRVMAWLWLLAGAIWLGASWCKYFAR
jgi:hypothetical protein